MQFLRNLATAFTPPARPTRIEPEILPPSTRASLENPAISLNDPAALARIFGLEMTAAGVSVSPESVLGIPAVLDAVRLIAETIGALPLHIYREPEGGGDRVLDHPLHRLLHTRPNPYSSAIKFRTTLAVHALLWGNGYAWIERNGAGQVVALWLFEPWFTRPVWDRRTGALSYEYRNGQIHRVLDPAEVIHIPWLEVAPGSGGLPVTQILRRVFGAALANIDFTGRFYENGAIPSIIFKTPDAMTAEGVREFAAHVKENAAGLGNAYKTMVMPQGVEADFPGQGLRDAQHIEQSRHQVLEIARIFNVPPHMLKDLERATFSNIEEQGLNFLRHTMWPWLVRITSEIDFKLLTPLNGPAFHAWFNTDPLTQGDRKSRMEAHSLAAQAGIMTRNEIRRLEGLPDLPGLDVPLTPVNTVGGVPAPVDPGDSDPSETD